MRETVVYLGPSLNARAARSVLDVVYLPPIRRGDLAKLGDEVTTVGIIDGEFYQNLAVSPKEVLPLLDRGIAVYGASSMGALRAVETCAYGMVGVGRIFEWYQDGTIDADDEVALAYDPETYRACSAPLVNIRFALRAAVDEGVVTPAQAETVIGALQKIYFPQRTYGQVFRICPELKEFVALRRPDQKRDDAILLLETIRSQTKPGN